MTTAYAMTDTPIEYQEDAGSEYHIYGLLEISVEEGDDCAAIHVEDATGGVDLRLDRAELEALIAAAQNALDNLTD